jgi:hypothetical protein
MQYDEVTADVFPLLVIDFVDNVKEKFGPIERKLAAASRQTGAAVLFTTERPDCPSTSPWRDPGTVLRNAENIVIPLLVVPAIHSDNLR